MTLYNTAQAQRCERCGELYPDGDGHSCGSQDNVGAVSSPSLTPSAPAAVASSNDDLIGTVIGGRFDILERLTAGGMGVVYRARHVLLPHHLAVDREGEVGLRGRGGAAEDEAAQRGGEERGLAGGDGRVAHAGGEGGEEIGDVGQGMVLALPRDEDATKRRGDLVGGAIPEDLVAAVPP